MWIDPWNKGKEQSEHGTGQEQEDEHEQTRWSITSESDTAMNNAHKYPQITNINIIYHCQFIKFIKLK